MSQTLDLLIVEDEPVVRQAAERILRSEGLSLAMADDAEQAADSLRKHEFKVVLTDLMLPGSSGFEVIDLAGRISPAPQIIVITGYATVDNALRCFQLDAFDFLPKPFDLSELLGVVKRGLRLHRRAPAELPTRPGSSEGQCHFLGRHAWAAVDVDGSATLGVGETFPRLLGEIESLELPAVDEHTAQGQRCVLIHGRDGLTHRVWAPLSGRIIAVNERLRTDYDLIDRAPFTDGWLVRIIPENLEEELELLTRS